jgi:thiamine biosynthesis lipoprotein
MLRRARPLLGTLVEVGVIAGAPVGDRDSTADLDTSFDEKAAMAAIDAAFATVERLQHELSRFEPASDIGRFNALPAGASLAVGADAAIVLAAAQALHAASDGLFDASTGSAPRGWQLRGGRLVKLDGRARLDLGGIAKGHAVDRAVEALLAAGCGAGWVNAGGDLRAFGAVEVPIALRDEDGGGVRPFARLAEGAFCTSHCVAQGGCRFAGAGPDRPARHVSVAAPLCLWADALTKVVALSGDPAHPLLARHGATAWLH